MKRKRISGSSLVDGASSPTTSKSGISSISVLYTVYGDHKSLAFYPCVPLLFLRDDDPAFAAIDLQCLGDDHVLESHFIGFVLASIHSIISSIRRSLDRDAAM